jgi:hypothetical protein
MELNASGYLVFHYASMGRRARDANGPKEIIKIAGFVDFVRRPEL